MANGRRSIDWKKQPCHFTWNLKANYLTDYEETVRTIDNDLEQTPNLLGVENLLFRAYLEVSASRNHCEVKKALEFLDKADDYNRIHNESNKNLYDGYKHVASLNRMWIKDKCRDRTEVNKLLEGLQDIDSDHPVIGAVRATALMRLGPHAWEGIALQLFEAAERQFPGNAGFLYGAASMAGREMRYKRKPGAKYQELDKNGQELMDKEKVYWGKMSEGSIDEYQFAKSSLAQNNSRRPDENEQEAYSSLKEAYEMAPNVEEVFLILIRYERFHKQIDTAIERFKSLTEPLHKCAEVHHQLALCYKAKNENKLALHELNECLKLNKGHIYAILGKAKLLSQETSEGDDVKQCVEHLEKLLFVSENMVPENKLDLYYNLAALLEVKSTESTYSRIVLWHTVMEIASSSAFEKRNETTGKWQVTKKAEKMKKRAYDELKKEYPDQPEDLPLDKKLELCNLKFQNFEFKEVLDMLGKMKEAHFKIPHLLAKTNWKLGLEKEMEAETQKCEPTEATPYFEEARKNIYLAMQKGLTNIGGRKLLADIALSIARNYFHLDDRRSQPTTTADQGAHQPEPTRAPIPLESPCIKSYREAVRCGSVVASLELLRLVSPQLKTTTSRSQFLTILAEIDLCCSQQPSVHLHRDIKPLPFKDDQLDDLSTVDCEKMQNHIDNLMQEDLFFTQTWEEYFNMERRFLEERLTNNDKELELDGREEEADSTKLASKKTRYAGIKCCLHIRPLLDHIIVEFREKQLGIEDQETKLYFPLIRASKKSQNDNERKKETTESLHETLQRYFKIDMKRYYPKLFADLLEAQPGYDSKNDFLQSLIDVVNTYKHQTTKLDQLLKDIDDPVKLSRQCMDKVEEICNFFFNTMKKTRVLKEEVEQLEDDIRRGKHGKADELLKVLSNNEDFVVRIGSTWELLKKMALIRWSKKQQSGDNAKTELVAAESELVDGEFGFSHGLRRCHLTVELLKTKLHAKCRDTCREAADNLALVLSKKKKKPHGGQSATQQPMPFPFCDLHPGVDRVDQWKGEVKKHLNQELNEMGITGPVKENKELLETIMQAQPCTDEENYQFIAMEEFLKGGTITDTVSIKPNNQEEKTFQVLDLTRWITDNAEKIAIKIDTLKVAGQ